MTVDLGNTEYRWLINPDLDDVNCQFYIQQTGTYPQDPFGYISGANLRANAIRHESGSEQSHYSQYVAANSDPTKNIGTAVEPLLAPASTSEQAFANLISNTVQSRIEMIETATQEPEPFGAEYDAAGNFQGFTNYATYVGCHP